MATYLLTWNPSRWTWESLEQDLAAFRTEGVVRREWSCGNRRHVVAGDRFLLLKQGPDQPKGIIGAGRILGEVRQGTHFSDSMAEAN